ncbi:MAG: RHS repeat-associated core domain-containing protein [Candidatus Polarisedimenticolia bacterium]
MLEAVREAAGEQRSGSLTPGIAEDGFGVIGPQVPNPTSPAKRRAVRGLRENRARNQAKLMKARYYSPAGTFRFASVDPVLASAHKDMPQSWNRYSYALNNPLNLYDPSGKTWTATNNAYKSMSAMRQSVPPADRGAITLKIQNDGSSRIEVDKNHKSKDLNFNNYQAVANDNAVVDVKQVGPSDKMSTLTPNGAPQTFSFNDMKNTMNLQDQGITFPDKALAGPNDQTSAQPGVTEVYLNSKYSDYDQAPVIAAEAAGHVVPGLQGQGFTSNPTTHTARETPARNDAINNRNK